MSTFDQGANAAINGLRADANPFFGEFSADEAEWDSGYEFGLEVLGDGDDYETPPRDFADEELPF